MIGRCSSVVEHFLGKEEVDSSILFNGSYPPKLSQRRRVELNEESKKMMNNVPGNGQEPEF